MIPIPYRLDVYDDAGQPRGALTGSAAGGSENRSGFLQLFCQQRVNAPGLLQFSLRGDHPLLNDLADKWQFEAWWKPGSTWKRILSGIFRASQWSYGDKETIVLYAPGVMSLLGMRIVNYPADTANRTRFVNKPAETIMKSLVTYNITSAATTGNGRKRNGAAWPATQIAVEADGAGGNNLDWYCFGAGLLDTLQKLAPLAGGDFDLVKTSPTSYEFRWYDGQLGTDRTSTLKFALSRGNMGAPQFEQSWIDEKTVACVWGQGEGAERDYLTLTGSGYAADNDIEMFVNASDVALGDTAGLTARGMEKLRQSEPVRNFRFRVLQSPGARFGIDYDLGDLGTVLNPVTGESYTHQVVAATHQLDSSGQQSIMVETAAK